MSYTKTNTFTAGNPVLASQLETEFTNIQTAVSGVTASGSKANGQLLIGNGTAFVSGTLEAGANITITPGAGTITIASTGGGGDGTVESVAVSGGTTGLTTSGGPITTTGTITLGGTLVVANGGTGRSTLTASNVLLGNGTNAVNFVAPGSNGNVLTSSGGTWISAAPTGTTYTAGAGLTLSGNQFSITSITSGAATAGALRYAGTTSTAGQLYGGTTNPSGTTRLNYGGNFHASNMTSATFNATSSARYKENVLDLSSGLDIIEQLRPVSFEWKDKSVDGRTHIGFIAEETETVLPEAVWQNEEGVADSISYQQLIPVLVNAIKQLSEEIKRLKNA